MIVAFAGQKGGVGKSTTAVCLAVAALEAGSRVLLVDADPQGTVRTWGEVAAERKRPAPTVIAMGASMHKSGQLADLAAGFDMTFIDCPPRHGEVQRSALMVADVVVLPCGASAADAWALATSLEVVREARAMRDELVACVLITRKQGRTALGKSARKVLESTGLPVLETELGSRIAYQESLAVGQGITTYASRDPGSREILDLLDELGRLFHGQEASGRFVAQAAAR
jgi:chromosome partitioning protein